MKMLDILLDYMDEHVTGDENCRLYTTRDEWNDFGEGEDFSWCYEENHGINGSLFLVKDLVQNLGIKSIKDSFYSFRSKHHYPKLSSMTDDQLLELFQDWLSSYRYNYCSPFSCGGDQEWDWEVREIDGKQFILTFCYMGS